MLSQLASLPSMLQGPAALTELLAEKGKAWIKLGNPYSWTQDRAGKELNRLGKCLCENLAILVFMVLSFMFYKLNNYTVFLKKLFPIWE